MFLVFISRRAKIMVINNFKMIIYNQFQKFRGYKTFI